MILGNKSREGVTFDPCFGSYVPRTIFRTQNANTTKLVNDIWVPTLHVTERGWRYR